MTMGVVLVVCGIYWIAGALIVNTKNWQSALLFKVIPFFTGLANIVCAMDAFGWINIF